MIDTPFDPDDIDFTACAMLGEGVWGRVYDLGDGAVLKLARDKSAGIGSGREKIAREYQTLRDLQNNETINALISRPLGKGDLSAASPLAGQGYDLWLRSSKIEGKTYSVDEVDDMPADRQKILAQNIGITLARLHRALQSAKPQAAKTDRYAQIAAQTKDDPFLATCVAALRQEYAHIPDAIKSRQCHGDYNISNLLFDDLSVCGILDFAECGPDFPEKDISDIVNELPCLQEDMISAYETESGFTVDHRRLALGIAENGLFSVVIAKNRNDAEELEWGRSILTEQLQQCGYKISPPQTMHNVKPG